MNRLVVLGGSLSGLAVAQAASARFRETVVIERDVYPSGPEPRPGTPHARQSHLLLQRGEAILERLLPGVTDALLQGGAYRLNWPEEVRWHHFGGLKERHALRFETLACTRLLLEHVVRQHVLARREVRVDNRAVVEGLVFDESCGRVAGVRFRQRGQSHVLHADLVVDATGRHSAAARWLAELGREPAPEEVIDAHVGYATRLYAPPQALPNWKGLVVHPTPPTQNRLGAIVTMEQGRWQVVMGGTNGDHPPTDEQGFMAFAESLGVPELVSALRAARPLSSIRGYRDTENRRRLYARVDHPTEGFVATGDAFCAFNPVYGQGITTAMMGAELLARLLARRSPRRRGFARTFHGELERALWLPWFLASSEDSRYPATDNGVQAGSWVKLFQRYVDGVIAASVSSPAAYRAFIEVMNMVRSPVALMRPDVIAAVVAGRLAGFEPVWVRPAGAP